MKCAKGTAINQNIQYPKLHINDLHVNYIGCLETVLGKERAERNWRKGVTIAMTRAMKVKTRKQD